jgi:hypothetical protein
MFGLPRLEEGTLFSKSLETLMFSHYLEKAPSAAPGGGHIVFKKFGNICVFTIFGESPINMFQTKRYPYFQRATIA